MIQDVLTRFEQYNKEMSPLGDAMDGTKLQAAAATVQTDSDHGKLHSSDGHCFV